MVATESVTIRVPVGMAKYLSKESRIQRLIIVGINASGNKFILSSRLGFS